MRQLAYIALLVAGLGACTTGTIEDGGTVDPPGGGGAGGGGGGGEEPGTGSTRTVDIQGPDVLPHVQVFANAACSNVDTCIISTYNGHSPTASRALDILVTPAYGQVATDGNALGDKLAAYALAHQAEFAITYVIWLQRYNDGRGWDPMEDRGSITQNHYDHVHISFDATP